jgi:hypothetical protein
MTIETKGTIELKDITAVEFRCKQCGHASIRKINDDLKIPALCGNCDRQYHLGYGPDGQELRNFLYQLAKYASRDAPYSLRFHVEGLEKSALSRPDNSTT